MTLQRSLNQALEWEKEPESRAVSCCDWLAFAAALQRHHSTQRISCDQRRCAGPTKIEHTHVMCFAFGDLEQQLIRVCNNLFLDQRCNQPHFQLQRSSTVHVIASKLIPVLLVLTSRNLAGSTVWSVGTDSTPSWQSPLTSAWRAKTYELVSTCSHMAKAHNLPKMP